MKRIYRGEDERFVSVIQALQVVAGEADEQIALLEVFRSIAEQIRQGRPIKLIDEELKAEGLLPSRVSQTIAAIDEVFDQIVSCDDENLFSAQALREAAPWLRLRKLARQALHEFGIPSRHD